MMTRRDLSPSSPEAEGVSRPGLQRIDAVLQAHIDAGALAGAVTLVARHGRMIHVKTMGLKDIASGDRVEPDTIFRIFSMTKPITAVAMMILHDEGRWHAEDPIAKHLPELAGMRVFAGLDADGAFILEPAHHEPTMRELMSHQAGFAYGTGLDMADPVNRLYAEKGVLRATDLRDMVARLGTLPLAYQPGSQWRYSLSMDVQGAIVERLSGRALPDFMAEHIFEPLGMVDTAFHVPPEKQHRLATLYFREGDGPLTVIANPMSPDYIVPPELPLGGGGLVSTASDYARFAQMMLDRGTFDGRRIVSDAAIELMTTNQLPNALLEMGFKAGHQEFRPGFGYGYNGVVITDPAAADLPVGKGSYFWDGAAGTFFWIDPVNDLLFVGLVQVLSWASPPLQAPTQRLMADALVPD